MESEIVHLHRAAGLHAEKVPLSGAAGGSYTGDVMVDHDLRAEVKARAHGEGFKTLERWLGGCHLLFLRRDRSTPMVVMEWDTYMELIKARHQAKTGEAHD